MTMMGELLLNPVKVDGIHTMRGFGVRVGRQSKETVEVDGNNMESSWYYINNNVVAVSK